MLTWCEILSLVNHENIVFVKLRSFQLPQLEISIMRQSDPLVIQVHHLPPYLLRIIGKILDSNSITNIIAWQP